MGRRSFVFTLAALAAVVFVGGAGAWACTSAGGPFINDLFNQRSSVGTPVDVRGGGWLASAPVELSLSVAQSSSGAPDVSAPGASSRTALGTAVTGPAGALSASVALPATVPPGYYYLGVTQGSITRFTPLQLFADVATAPVAGASAVGGASTPPAGAQEWAGLNSDLAGGGLAGATHGEGSALPLAAVAGVALAVFTVLGTTEVRRRARAS